MEEGSAVTVPLSPMGTTPVRAADFKEIYANLCRIGFSNSDIQLTFSLGTNDAVGAAIIQEKTTIFLAPSQAKSVAGILVNAVKEFEAQFGEIKLDARQEPLITEQPTTKAPAQE